MASWGNCDFSQLQKLRDNIEKLDKGRQKFCEDCARELAARLLALVIPRTPVGRKPTLVQLGGEGTKKFYKTKGASGKVRSFLTREGAILSQHWSGYVGGTLRRGWTVGGIEQNGDGYRITVINPVGYASYVEFGHRQTPGRYVPAIGKRLKKAWVKGQYMLTLSEKDLQKWIPGYLEKKLQAYLMEAFKDG